MERFTEYRAGVPVVTYGAGRTVFKINGTNGMELVRFQHVYSSKPEKDVRMQKPVLTC